MMFIESDEFMKRIQTIADEIAEKTDNMVLFEEFIALPYYGNIILRFNLAEPITAVSDLDSYENVMYAVAKDEFLIDFMGNVYRDAGVDYRDVDDLLRKAYVRYKQEVVHKSKYARRIIEDAEFLLAQCNLKRTERVWEIQLEDEILLLIMKARPGEPQKHVVNGRTMIVIEVDEVCCEGLMKAAVYAKRNKISLAHAMLAL